MSEHSLDGRALDRPVGWATHQQREHERQKRRTRAVLLWSIAVGAGLWGLAIFYILTRGSV